MKTSEAAGDDMTTATLLAYAMISIGLKRIEAGLNPMEVRRGIGKAVRTVVDFMKQQSIPIGSDPAKIEQVATISANNDSEIGKLIAEAMTRAGEESVVTIEEAKGIETTIEAVEGMRFDRGYLSPYFVTESEKMEVVFEKPNILVCDRKISGIKEFLPVLEKAAQTGAPLLIIAEDVDADILTTLVVNNLHCVLKVPAVKARGFGDRRKDQLEDIAVLTGATVISEEKGLPLEKADTGHLGPCDKVIINKNNTTIVNGAGEKQALDARIAMQEGIIPGGGVTYLRSMAALDNLKYENEEEKAGIEIVKKSLEEPVKQLAINAGLEPNDVLPGIRAGNSDYGFNFKTEMYERLLAGVIDPTKVGRLALEHAVSVAMMMLTTECVIAKAREEGKKSAPAMAAL